MKKNWRTTIYAIVVFLLAISPVLLNRYWIDVLNTVGLYALLGLSLNLIVGHSGLFNLGHAAFYAVGAYTAAILNTRFGIPILLLLPVCGLTAGLCADDCPSIIHLRNGLYALSRLSRGNCRIALINNIFGITGGANGIFGISRFRVF